jgi:hypothetical protein
LHYLAIDGLRISITPLEAAEDSQVKLQREACGMLPDRLLEPDFYAPAQSDWTMDFKRGW